MNSNNAKTVIKKHRNPFWIFPCLKYLTGSAITQARFTTGFNKNRIIRTFMNDESGARFHPPRKSYIDPKNSNNNSWGNTAPMVRRRIKLSAYLIKLNLQSAYLHPLVRWRLLLIVRVAGFNVITNIIGHIMCRAGHNDFLAFLIKN